MGFVIPIGAQDAGGCTVGVVKLAGFDGPKEKRQPKAAQQQRNWDKVDKDVHMRPISKCPYFSRSAFSETVIDDSDIARAAASGVARPTSASGTAMML